MLEQAFAINNTKVIRTFFQCTPYPKENLYAKEKSEAVQNEWANNHSARTVNVSSKATQWALSLGNTLL
jgi:hypothetical protein